MYDQIHQEQIVAREMTQHIVEIPAVQEQVIVQEIPQVSIVERIQEQIVSSAPQVVGSLPPLHEFTATVYNQVLQEQIVAFEMTQNIDENPSVQEQLIVQEIPQVSFVERIQELCSFTGLMNAQISTTSLEASQVVGSFPFLEKCCCTRVQPSPSGTNRCDSTAACSFS